MPRGDGKKPGEPRTRRRTGAPQYVPKVLAARQKAFDEQKDKHGETRPGSQKGK